MNEDLRSDLAAVLSSLTVIRLALQSAAAEAASHNAALASLAEMTGEAMDAAAAALERLSRPAVGVDCGLLADGTVH